MGKQANLSGFLGDSPVYEGLLNKIKTIEAADKEGKDIREMEMVLFRPDNIKTVEINGDKIIPEAVKVYFRDKRYYMLFEKYFTVNHYVESNTHTIETLILFMLLLENGIITKTEEGGIIS